MLYLTCNEVAFFIFSSFMQNELQKYQDQVDKLMEKPGAKTKTIPRELSVSL